MFQEQKKNFDVIGVEFHKTPAITFLRLQNPDSYGDDVSDYRETVVSVNKLKSKQKGLELDKSGLAIRGVVPVFYDKEHIGSLEFMFSFMSILNKIKKNSGADISIFVSKKKYDDIFIETSNKNEKMEDKIIEEKNKKANTVDKFIFLESTNKEKIMSIVTSRYLNKGTVFYTVYPKVNGKEEGLAIEPLFDFSGAKIGAIVISKNFDKLNAQYKNKFKANVAIKLFQVLLVSIISVLIYNVWLMMPLYKMSTVLKNRLNGQHDTFDELTKKKNEIGSLARVLQKLCESSENALKDAKPKREDKKKKESDD